MKIAIVDYGAGNLASVVKALAAVGASPAIARAPRDLDGVAGIVIPGVGHFAATERLDADWRARMLAAVSPHAGARPVPLLGICLGMQWLFDASEEAPDLRGLGLLSGRVARLTGDADRNGGTRIKVPHAGWNTLDIATRTTAFAGLGPRPAMYFTHGYAVPASDDACATTTHGGAFVSAAVRGRVWGAQFHPEKSGAAGLTFLRNWITLCSSNG